MNFSSLKDSFGRINTNMLVTQPQEEWKMNNQYNHYKNIRQLLFFQLVQSC